jgi:LacI family transcriptional regulator
MQKRKIRLADVARKAGVSVATVDRVVHGRPGVRPNTQRLIREVMTRLDEPNCDALQGARDAPASHDLTFDFILPAGPNTFMQNLEQAVFDAPGRASLAGIATRCHRVPGFDPDALAACIARIGRNTDGLAIVALDNPVVREAINELSQHGTPVVTLVSDLYSTGRIGYAGPDNRAAGRTAAYLMGRFTGGSGEILIAAGSLSLNYRDHEEREMGFRNALREQFPGLQIVERVENHDNHEQAYAQMLQVLRDRPGLTGIYNIGAGNRGIGNALQEQGHSETLVFIGHELTRYTRSFLVSGTMDAVIDQNPSGQCKVAIRMLQDFHGGQAGSVHPGPASIEIYIRENLP